MKKINLSLMLIMLWITGSAQITTDPANGNVGIGTTTPNHKLSVLGNISASVGANEGPSLILENPNKTGSTQAHRWVLYNMTGPYGDGLQFWNYNQGSTMYTSRFTIADNGNVGITGNVKLATRANSYQIDYASLSETKGGASTIIGNNVVAGTLSDNSVRRSIVPTDPGTFMSLSYYHGITFHTGVVSALNTEMPVEDSEKMRITQTGNVLIGKNGQANTSYKLDVNGKVRANEIVVNTTGADFVFEKDYKLRPLEEVETFVKQNKHLPEIASAKTMQTAGVGVSELQTKLLQKIEELTLYVIQQQKEINELKKKIDK